MRTFKAICEELEGITAAKRMMYGNSRYDPHSDQFNFWMCFSDVHRKTLRLEELTEQALGSAGAEARPKLIDDYKDIANYAIMAVMLLEEK